MWFPNEVWHLILKFMLPKDPPWKRRFNKTMTQIIDTRVLRRRPTIIHSTQGILCVTYYLKINGLGYWRRQLEHFYL